MRHQADQVGEVHPSKCLVEVAEVAVRHHLQQRPSPRGLLRQHSKDFCGLFEEASLLGFAAAEVQHQPKQLRTGQSLDDCALPLVELGRLLRVLHVAVGAGVAVLAVPGDEVDARAPAYLWMSKAALTEQREELCQDRRMLRLLQHLGAHGALWAGAASSGGRLILKLHQFCCPLGEGAHVASHGVLLAGGFQAETDAPHPPWRRALRARPAGTHLLEVFLHVDKGVAVLELQSHGEETLRGQTSWCKCVQKSKRPQTCLPARCRACALQTLRLLLKLIWLAACTRRSAGLHLSTTLFWDLFSAHWEGACHLAMRSSSCRSPMAG